MLILILDEFSVVVLNPFSLKIYPYKASFMWKLVEKKMNKPVKLSV